MSRPSEKDLIRVINYLWASDDIGAATKAGRFRLIGGKAKSVNVGECLIAPHSRGRLAEAIRLTKAGKQMPPINCERVIVGPHVFYNVSDGNHRVAACRELDKLTVPALVASQIVVDAGPLSIFDFSSGPALWRMVVAPNQPTYFRLVVWLGDLSESEGEALKWLLAEAAKVRLWPIMDAWRAWPVGTGFEIDGLPEYVFRKVSASEADRLSRLGVWLGRVTVTGETSRHQELWVRRTWDDAIDAD